MCNCTTIQNKDALIVELAECIEREAKMKAISFYQRGNKGIQGDLTFTESADKADASWEFFLMAESKSALQKIKQ
jgi:hypothetical protein